MSQFRHSTPDESPGFLVWKLTSLWQQRLAEVLSEFGINQTQFAIMASLKWFSEASETATQASLGEHARIEKMTLSKSIRLLEDDGLVLRSKCKDDGRSVSVRLSKQGIRVVDKTIVAVENADELFFGGLSPGDLQEFKRLTKRIVEANVES